MKIYFQNFGVSFLKGKIKKIYITALNCLDINFKGFSVNLRFVDRFEIQSLNKKFRNLDKPTDVLSFPCLNFKKGKGVSTEILSKNLSPEDGLVSLGDIAICKEIAKIQAKEYGHSIKREVCFLALHGFLHLLGFDHLTQDDDEEMQEIANKILKIEKVERNV